MFSSSFFFFNDTATTEIYTLSLHDALPIWFARAIVQNRLLRMAAREGRIFERHNSGDRSEEHTSELQSPCNLVCRLLLEKKKTMTCLLHISTTTAHRSKRRSMHDAAEELTR